MEHQPVGPLGVGEEQHLSRLQVLRQHRPGQHHVAGREPRLHRAGDDHVSREADQPGRQGQEHQAGHGHQHGRDDRAVHGGRAQAPPRERGAGLAGARGAADHGGRGHGVFRASHVNVALDCLFCAPLSSLRK